MNELFQKKFTKTYFFKKKKFTKTFISVFLFALLFIKKIIIKPTYLFLVNSPLEMGKILLLLFVKYELSGKKTVHKNLVKSSKFQKVILFLKHRISHNSFIILS